MAVECSCPQCAARYKVDDRFAGKKVRCKKCGAGILVAASGGNSGFDEVEEVGESSVMTSPAKSVAGRSHAPARHAATPPPPPPAMTPIGPPPIVTHQPVVVAPSRVPRRPKSGPTQTFLGDAMAGWISMTMVLAVVILFFISGFKGHEALKAEKDTFIADKAGGISAIQTAGSIGGFFLLVVPAVLVARMIGGTVDPNAPSIDLIRVAGVAAAPLCIVAVFAVLGKNVQDIRAALGLAIIMIPVMLLLTGLAIRELLQLSIGATALTFLLCAIFGTMAMFGSGAVTLYCIGSYVGERPEPPRPAWMQPQVAVSNTPSSGGGSALGGLVSGARPGSTSGGSFPRPTAPIDPYASELQGMIPRLDERISQSQNFTREQLQSFWSPQLEHFEKLEVKTDSPLYVQYAERITRIKGMMAAAPSDQAPPEVFAALANPFELINAPADAPLLAEPVKLGPVAIQPLKAAKLDLSRVGQKSTSLSWTLASAPSARVTLSLIPRRVEKQTRPWLLTSKSVQTIAEGKGFYVLEYPTPLETVVKVGGLTMVRLAPAQGMNPERRIYAGVHDGQFVELTLSYDRPEDKPTFSQLEAMARSLRVASEGGDAFAIAAIVPRLEDDFASAAPVIEAAGSDAEDAVLAWAKSTGKTPSAEVQGLLRKIGTRKSAAYLAGLGVAPVAPPSGGASPAAPSAEKQVMPAAMVLEKFELELDPAKKIEMLEGLARQTPGGNRDELATMLEGIILAPNNDALLPATAKALAVWHGPKSVEAIRPMLDKGVPQPYRRAAITALAGTKNAKMVMPILLCMQDEPEATVAALIAMGPMTEPDVIKLLRENDPNVRRNGARVLKEIGTSKCVGPLKAVINPNEPAFAEAFDAVVARRRAGGK